jgi:hypothetical protein
MVALLYYGGNAQQFVVIVETMYVLYVVGTGDLNNIYRASG